MNNIREVLERAVKMGPDKPYLWFNGELTFFHDLYEHAAKAGNAIRSLGIQKGDRVALMLPNIPEFLYIWLGLNSIGISIVPINTYYKEKETAYLVNHSEVKCIITHQDYYSIFEAIKNDCPNVQSLVIVGSEEWQQNGINYKQLVEKQSTILPNVPVSQDDEASILYTSGTTGLPKGCVQTHAYYLIAGKRYSEHLRLTSEDCVLTPLPLFHMNPQILSTMGSLWVGARLALLDRFHPTNWWQSLRESGATVFHYQGVMPAILIGMKESEDDADHPHWIGMGAGVPPRLHKEFEQRFNVSLLEGFGMTECGLNFLPHVDEDRKIGNACFGKVFPEYEAKVFDDDDREVLIGEIGELVLRGSNPEDRKLGFMKEYYRNPEETEKVWGNNWFHTGDFVKQDEEGYFYFVDRKKDIIRRSGENISALEVEDVIRSYPSVLGAAVVPVPDPIREQEVKAYVISKDNKALDWLPLIEWCQENLAYFKIPRYWEQREEFPLTKTGKVQKQVLKSEEPDLRLNSYDRVENIFREKIKL
jgi:carnitine-CoA ligase